MPFMFRIILRAYRVRTYDFEEDTICKGAFYILSPEDSYEIEELPPEKGIIKGVFTYDYTEPGQRHPHPPLHPLL